MVQVADGRNIAPQAQPSYHMLHITQAADNSVGLSEGGTAEVHILVQGLPIQLGWRCVT